MHVINKAGDSLETIKDYINKQYPVIIASPIGVAKSVSFLLGKVHSMVKDVKKANCQALLLEETIT